MTTSTSAGPPVPAVRPHRVRLLRRYLIARSARIDAANGRPDPDAIPRPTSTDARSRLKSALYSGLSALWESYVADERGREAERRLIDARVATLQARLDDAQAVVDGIGTAPDAADGLPCRGEIAHGRSDELVARRRRRQHERRLTEARRTRDALRDEIGGLQQRRAELAAQSAGHAYQIAVGEHRAIGTFCAERAVYDDALVRRHPRGRTDVERMLDRAPPELSTWATAALLGRPVPPPAAGSTTPEV